jgi:hypothetical protein
MSPELGHIVVVRVAFLMEHTAEDKHSTYVNITTTSRLKIADPNPKTMCILNTSQICIVNCDS